MQVIVVEANITLGKLSVFFILDRTFMEIPVILKLKKAIPSATPKLSVYHNLLSSI